MNTCDLRQKRQRLGALGNGLSRVAAVALGAWLAWAPPSSAFHGSTLDPQSKHALLAAQPSPLPPAASSPQPIAGAQGGAAGGSRPPLPYSPSPQPSPPSPSQASLVQAVTAEEYAYHRQTGQYIPPTQDNLRLLMQRIGAPEEARNFVWGLLLRYANDTQSPPAVKDAEDYVQGEGGLTLHLDAPHEPNCKHAVVGEGLSHGPSLSRELSHAIAAEEYAYYQRTRRYIPANGTNVCLLMRKIGARPDKFGEGKILKEMREYSQGRRKPPSPPTEGGRDTLPPPTNQSRESQGQGNPAPPPDQSGESRAQADPELCQKARQDHAKCMQEAREAADLGHQSIAASMRATCAQFLSLCQ